MEHPTFGRVPRVVTLKDMKAGTELTCHYMICMEEASAPDAKMTWYVDLWDKFSRNLLATEAEENGKTCEEDMDESSDNECNNDNVVDEQSVIVQINGFLSVLHTTSATVFPNIFL